jgi:hypothetical protein
MDAGGVLHYTQVGFEAGDEKKYGYQQESVISV